jgi:cell wall-associated NlpC family hydrolase
MDAPCTRADPAHGIGILRFFLLLSVLLLGACASTDNNVLTHDTGSSAIVRKITSYAWSLRGIPYKYGGHSPDTGFDCSGFVDHVFQHTANVLLPHDAQQISRHGFKIKSSQLREGDLVFYNTNNQAFSHVGIYLGNGRFIHAPSSGGNVRVEDMKLDYWKKHYNGARRITLRG